MRECPNCGCPLDEQTALCPSCGQNIAVPDAAPAEPAPVQEGLAAPAAGENCINEKAPAPGAQPGGEAAPAPANTAPRAEYTWAPPAESGPVNTLPPPPPGLPHHPGRPMPPPPRPQEPSVAHLLGTLAVLALPLFGVVFCLLWGFGKKGHPLRRKLARAVLILHAIGLAVAGILLSLLFALGLTPDAIYYSGYEEGYYYGYEDGYYYGYEDGYSDSSGFGFGFPEDFFGDFFGGFGDYGGYEDYYGGYGSDLPYDPYAQALPGGETA
ncbi:MAG: hypothetical protein IJ484_01455 [Oscillospiraceae bacterium]|nr:hypothetical protein [Oscillospiraceae bacterium]